MLALLREEFRISKLTLHSDLRRGAALRLALPCPSSLGSIFSVPIVSVQSAASSLLRHDPLPNSANSVFAAFSCSLLDAHQLLTIETQSCRRRRAMSTSFGSTSVQPCLSSNRWAYTISATRYTGGFCRRVLLSASQLFRRLVVPHVYDENKAH